MRRFAVRAARLPVPRRLGAQPSGRRRVRMSPEQIALLRTLRPEPHSAAICRDSCGCRTWMRYDFLPSAGQVVETGPRDSDGAAPPPPQREAE